MPAERRKLSCLGCRHYFVTHDPNFPYGCRLLQFKSRRMPWDEVLAANGAPCAGREEKPAGEQGR